MVDAIQEALALFFVRDMQEELHDARTASVQVGLVVTDRAQPVVPEITRLDAAFGQALRGEVLRMHAHHQHFLVVRTVEDADPAPLRQPQRGAPEEIVVELLGLGCLKLETWQPSGFTPDSTCLMAPSLPAASMAWKISSSE